MRFAIGVPNVGPFGDPGLLVDLAVQTEQAGWDGWFVWDHLLYHDPSWPVADPLVTLSAVAACTQRIQLGVLMLALPMRRPWKVAKELASIDRLSSGRLVAGFGLGSMAREYSAFAEDSELPTRAEKLEEGLEVIARSWTGEEVSFDGFDSTRPVRAQRRQVERWAPCHGRRGCGCGSVGSDRMRGGLRVHD